MNVSAEEDQMAARPLLILAITLLLFGTGTPLWAQQNPMSFFVTSVGLGNGGDLGGLSGADRHCQTLAAAAGAGSKTWHAYLSTQGTSGVNAKDRIGAGPWTNAKGVQVAASVAELHGDKNNINKQTALDEKGAVVNGRGDTPNQHDMLTGHSTTAPPCRDRKMRPAVTGPIVPTARAAQWLVTMT
jgi:hypothetical protein